MSQGSQSGIRAALVLSLMALGACVSTQTSAPSGRVASGAFPVSVENARFLAHVSAGQAGVMATAAGARAVAGHEIRVAREGQALRFDEGRLAKVAAAAGCAMAAGRFNAAALGRFDRARAEWVFAGGCA